MKKTMLVAALVFLAAVCYAQDKVNRLEFPKNGFSIAPLEGTSDSTTYQVVTLYLPPTGNFSPNVNVQVQPYTGTIEEYLALSKQQFEAMKWTLVKDSVVGPNAITFEYTGTMQGYLLHFYARAESKNGKIYLATGSTTGDQWPDSSPRIKKCVNSFRLD